MREDPGKSNTFRELEFWDGQRYVNKVMVPTNHDPGSPYEPTYKFTSHSLSGNERNRMFLQWAGSFSDVSLISGADDLADGRSFGLIDFDQDGWQDIALMSLNAPRFKLYRNQMGALSKNRSFRFRLIGAQNNAQPNQSVSNRDAIGSRVKVKFESGRTNLLQKQAGEGFSSQNSETQHIGIPEGDAIATIEIRWPSGRKTVMEKPDASKILIIREESN